ncbi:hypothetical protein DPMN_109461 [Dreissena polymorpha]|uniref:Uncharacterized protein n=1 Tax=Dreissena polymorpha TaxID=45954 RepID=A0A9D4KAB5_DREPO|nr:hypothetical protein DPMN_109461 [Dreissena polymorpha]
MSTAVLEHFRDLHRTIASKYWHVSLPKVCPIRPSSTLPAPLLPSLFRRRSETTIHLRTLTILLGDPSKFWESAKSVREDARVEGSLD